MQKIYNIHSHQNFVLAVQGVGYEMWEELRQILTLDLAIPTPTYIPISMSWIGADTVDVWIRSSNEDKIDFEELVDSPHVTCTGEGLCYNKAVIIKLAEKINVRVRWDFTIPYPEKVKQLFTEMGIMKTHTHSDVSSYTSVSCDALKGGW